MALVALCIIHRFAPAWLTVDITEASSKLSYSAERVSRLASRATALFEATLGELTRRGRPAHDDGQHSSASELAVTQALLAAATAVLSVTKLRPGKVREIVVGASSRLQTEHGVTQKRFCEVLALPVRTLRSWLQPKSSEQPEPTALGPEATSKPGKRKRGMRRGRFGFDVTLPQTQVAADTTDLRAFGVGLKLVAAQDVGGRDANLFEQVVVQEADTAQHVIEVLTATLAALPGAQAITDQGTPYMAKATREALEAMQVEHAPQKEADPIGKSTVERAFLTIKSIAEPLLEMSNRLADKIPALRDTELAKGVVVLFLSALLRAYQCGSRAARRANTERAGVTPEQLSKRAEESRERAIARDRSNRQLLAHIHELYNIAKPLTRFVDSLRRYPNEVLREAESAFATQVHRDNLRDRASYFSAIVRRIHEDYARDRRRQQFERKEQERQRREHASWDCQLRAWQSEPAVWLRDALEMIASHWSPDDGKLLFDGVGAGTAYLSASLGRLLALHDWQDALDIASGVITVFEAANANILGPDALRAIRTVFDREVNRQTPRKTGCAPPQPAATLVALGRNQRPSPSDCLRN